MTKPKAPDWETVDKDTARIIFEQAEKRLGAQMSLAIAADTRAMSLATILFGVAGALLAFGINELSKIGLTSLSVSACLSSIPLFVGFFFVSYTARPLDFYVVGAEPHNWFEVTDSPMSVLYGVESENYDEMIFDNEGVLASNEVSLMKGIYFASAAPFVAAISFLLSRQIFCLG